jgi:hypothetical protein
MTGKRNSQITTESENDNSEVAQLKNMIAKMQADLDKMKSKEPEKELNYNDQIRVMSLYESDMYLSTKPRGAGKVFHFRKFGDIKRMFYSELLDIINNHPNFFEDGYFYIMDSRVIKANGYEDLYEKILDKGRMERIMTNADDALELFKGANAKQQGVIIDMLQQRMMNGEEVDFNLIANIGRIVDRDLSKEVKDAKENAGPITAGTKPKEEKK